MALEIRAVPAEAAVALRHAVLRPHAPLDAARLAGDGAPGGAVFAALEDGEVVSTAAVHREDAAGLRARGGPHWRLRAVATREDRRGLGLGSGVLAAVCEHVASHGGGLLWCTARLGARGFYLRHGFDAEGEEWVDPQTGPHVHMSRLIAPSPGR